MFPPGSSGMDLPIPPHSPGSDHQRLWTPWRMRYVAGGTAEEGCLFCKRLAAADDVGGLILHRGERVFAIMNLYPYNTGHLMLVPTDHVANPEEAAPATLTELATLLPAVTRAVRRALGCAGFNIGLNVGAVAGAGISDHLHQHVVPRWVGDANFMPILASTMVLPELIPVTYAKLRAELARERGRSPGQRKPSETAEIPCVVLSNDHALLLLVAQADRWQLPRVMATSGEAVWRTAARAIASRSHGEPELVGWAGARNAANDGPGALTFRLRGGGHVRPTEVDARWVQMASVSAELGDADGQILSNALANLAPSVAAT